MELGNFFRMCVYFSIVFILFSLAVIFINGLSIFTEVDSGIDDRIDLSTDPLAIFEIVSGFDGGMAGLWGILTIVTGITVFLLAKAFGSTTIIGVYFFSEIFWTSFTKAFSSLNIISSINMEFVALFIVGLCFIWVGAVISMFTNVS